MVWAVRVRLLADVFGRHGTRFGNRGAAAQVVTCAGEIRLALGDGGGVHGVVDVEAAHLAHRLRKLGTGIVERDFRIGRVQRDDRLARLDDLRVVGIDGHQRRELDEVAVDVSVVSIFVVLGHAQVVRAIAGSGHGGGQAQCYQQRLAVRLQVGGRGGVGFGNGLRFVLDRGVHLGTCLVRQCGWETVVQRVCVFCGASW